MQLKSLLSPIEQDMAAVDQIIRTRLRSEVVLINQLAEYIIGAGGKRLRPAVVLLAARACGYAGTGHHLLAAVIEFIHTATLLHDDVVDESLLRRGRDTANAVWGNQISVLTGDFLYSRAFQMMIELDSMDVMHSLADTTNTIAEGEVLQLLNCRDPGITEERYREVIWRKTAVLFQAGSRLGAALAAPTAPIVDALANYGLHLGVAFQLIDDALDYSADAQALGKNVGDDLAEGKPTLPLIYALKHGSADQKKELRAAIEHGNRDSLPQVLAAIESTGAIAYTAALAKEESEQAIAALAALPESPYKTALTQLARFAVERGY
ncbi:MAG: polyprenyl synthetase family protein [Nevskiales bacterium]